MKSQTARPVQRPKNQRPTRSTKQKQYSKQTAHVEARRDGKPLIFGWGGHLSRSEKTRIQRRATWTVAIIMVVLIVAVVVGFWVNINIITPNLPITTVNGHQIPQSLYRKLVAYKTQLEINKLNGPHGLIAQRKSLEDQISQHQTISNMDTSTINDLNTQIKKLPPGPGAQRTSLTAQVTVLQQKITQEQIAINGLNSQLSDLTNNIIPNEQQLFTSSQIGNDSATWLQDDELIHEWLATQSTAIQAKINPSSAAIQNALKNFKANFPTTSSYSHFLSQDKVSDDDVQAMIALELRRNNMQNYLAPLVVSPTYQVLARTMTIDTMADAQKVLQQLKRGGNFATIAAAKSVDATTSKSGGYLGWLARGQYAQTEQSAVVENWLFDPSRKLNEISPVLVENGAYHIVQILNIDPSRPVDKATLQTLQQSALTDWLLIQRSLPGVKITAPDQTRLFDSSNLPPDLPASAPGQSPGLPQPGMPPGVPSSGGPASGGP
jgi:parvulin-like peptidyl-prolyl isomerase